MNSREINDVKKVFNDSYQKTDQQWLKSYILEITEEEKYLEQLLLNLGFGNSVVAQKVVAIFSPGSSPMKRVRNEAKKENCLFDITHGRKTRNVIITENNHVLLSAIVVKTEQLLLNLGFGNSVVAQKVVAIFSPGSSPMKRVRNEAKKENCLFDVTHGRKTRSVIITECNHVILSSVKAETVSRRFASLLEEKSRKRND